VKYLIINGKLIEKNKAFISVEERMIRFSDGAFETCRIYKNQIYNFDSHLNRLKNAISELKINVNIDILEELSYKLINKNKISEGFLRISVSRGIGSHGYLPKKDISPLIIIENLPFLEKKEGEIRLAISKYKKISKDFLPHNYKISNNLISIIAKIEAEELNLFDVILLNEKEKISETSSSNIFWVKNEQIYTPSLECGIVAGTIRQKIIDNFDVIEGEFKISELSNIDEIFITNVNILVLKIDKINGIFTDNVLNNQKISKKIKNKLEFEKYE
jgi:branched-chain amino acid aminotransferase